MSETDTKQTRTYKILDTPTLIRANMKAIELNQNRSLSDEFLKMLDPGGTHVIGFMMHHENFEGTPGVRCHIYCKVKQSKVPVDVWLDVTHKEFNDFPTTTVEVVDSDINILSP